MAYTRENRFLEGKATALTDTFLSNLEGFGKR